MLNSEFYITGYEKAGWQIEGWIRRSLETVMGDKKKWFDEFIQSEEIKEYFQQLLNEQTKTLLDQISCRQDKYNREETAELEKKYNQELSRRIQLEEECVRLQGLLEKESEKAALTDKELRNVRQKYSQLQSDYDSVKEKKDNIGKHFAVYEAKYKSIDEAYSRYERLSEDAKGRLRNVFNTDSIYGFLTASADWRNVEGLWNFAKRRIVEKEMTDTEELVSIFEFMLQAYNMQEKEKYGLLMPDIGDKFDSDSHTIIGIKTDGFVSKVRLPGIIKLGSQRVIQKALIEI